ncbi:MAG TPA: CRISPR-associated RAMP protein Csx7 [Thermoanaerobaculia bacterium]|nr:CRISPR-associated RAMP protein Csx7 [Thermoanaerobaculia bacterium]
MNMEDLQPRPHAVLEKLMLFDYRLTCRTGLHIGAGKSADLAGSDLPVMRDAAGRPLVPGSSLRGVLRAGIASFCDSLRLDSVRSREDAAPSVLPAEFVAGWKKLCLVDRLFGAAADKEKEFSYGSRLQISDGLCTDDVAVELRDGVGIDRDTRTARTGVKYDLEVVPAGTRFLGRIRFKNPADYELGLLAQALWMLDQGLLLLGGKSARGLGWIQVEVTTPQLLRPAQILRRETRTESRQEFGPVDENLGESLGSLQQLADAVA